MAKLFFSYSHKDEVLRDKLQTHLEMLRRSGAIETWHDRRILAGEELDGAIDQNMQDSDIILLLVSSDFLASDYCYDVEVKSAMARHEAKTAQVIPVILRPCDWKEDTPFKKILATPRDGLAITKWPNEDEAFLDVVRKIREAVKECPNPQPVPPKLSEPHQPAVFSPRSSNLRLHKIFTQADKDRFIDEAFEYLAKYFEGSLDELSKRNDEIETKFKRIDAETFTAVIYRNGDAVSKCAIRHGSSSAFGEGIIYSSDDRGRGNSCNAQLLIKEIENSLCLTSSSTFSGMHGNALNALSHEGGADHFWSILMEPLQRGVI